jgi:hypothetical protein
MKIAKALLKGDKKQDKFTSAELLSHFKKKEAKSKYRNVRKEYNGRNYASTKEANTAMQLDMLKKSQIVEEWTPQVRFDLVVNDILVGVYVLDFLVVFSGGRIEHWDCKGNPDKSAVPYKLFDIKRKLMKAIYGIEVIEK